nr:hypothetical protein [Deltaproteobacteria bacterium]
MTTDTDKASPAQDEEDGSILPTVLAGAGILAVAALLIFWPSDDDASKSANAGGGKTGVSEANGGKAGGPRGRAAGVGARPSDAATPRPSSSTRNPAIKFPEGAHGMAPMPEEQAKDPPAGASTSDKIAFYEKRLDAAIIARDSRKKFADRL